MQLVLPTHSLIHLMLQIKATSRSRSMRNEQLSLLYIYEKEKSKFCHNFPYLLYNNLKKHYNSCNLSRGIKFEKYLKQCSIILHAHHVNVTKMLIVLPNENN